MTSTAAFPTLRHSSPRAIGAIALAAMLSVIASFLGAAMYLTQRIAHHLGYHEMLGLPLFGPVPGWMLMLWSLMVLVLLGTVLTARTWRPAAVAVLLPAVAAYALTQGPLYPPLVGLEWLPALLRTPSFRLFGVVAAGEALAVLGVGLGFTFALVRLAWPRAGDVTPVVHGSARFATGRDLAEADLLSGEGLVLGSVDGGRRPRLLTDRSGQHALIVMPPGAGRRRGRSPARCSTRPSTRRWCSIPRGSSTS